MGVLCMKNKYFMCVCEYNEPLFGWEFIYVEFIARIKYENIERLTFR